MIVWYLAYLVGNNAVQYHVLFLFLSMSTFSHDLVSWWPLLISNQYKKMLSWIFWEHGDPNFGTLGLWCLTPLSTIFQVISWRAALLVKETGIPGKHHMQWQSLSHNVVSSTLRHLKVTYCTGSCKSDYHTITTSPPPTMLVDDYEFQGKTPLKLSYHIVV
jgi:hypothetical protein